MSKYDYEIELNPISPEDLMSKIDELATGVKEIVEKYKIELKNTGILFSDTYHIDYEKGVAKIGSIQNDLPGQMKLELHTYFATKSFHNLEG